MQLSEWQNCLGMGRRKGTLRRAHKGNQRCRQRQEAAAATRVRHAIDVAAKAGDNRGLQKEQDAVEEGVLTGVYVLLVVGSRASGCGRVDEGLLYDRSPHKLVGRRLAKCTDHQNNARTFTEI